MEEFVTVIITLFLILSILTGGYALGKQINKDEQKFSFTSAMDSCIANGNDEYMCYAFLVNKYDSLITKKK